MEEPNIASLTERFDNYLEIISLYDNLVGDLNEIPIATQYEESQNWLSETAEIIKEHVDMYEIDQTENIEILKNTILSLKKYTNLFKGGELSEPILNITDFHDLLNKSGFDLSTKVSIKKAIGQANYNLVVNKTLKPEEKESFIDKYKNFYEKTISIYDEEINKITEIVLKDNIDINITEALDTISNLSNKYPEFSYKEIQNTVVSILLKKELDFYEQNLKNEELKNNLIDNCEKIISISENTSLIKTPEEEKVDKIILESEQLISQAKEILDTESELLNDSVNNEQTIQQLTSISSDEDNRLTLTILLESIKQNVTLLETYLQEYKDSPELYEQKCKEEILNINEYIETYNIIKNRLEITQEKTK